MPAPVVSDIAPGVRQLTIHSTVSIHAYLIDTPDGTVAFDTGTSGSGPAIGAAAGGVVAKVILSHSHTEHRGGAQELEAPIYCHPDELEDAEGQGGQQYIDWALVPASREGLRDLHSSWDGGPVSIAGTVQEGHRIAGFQVLHLPGHAPGLIALYRESDRLLLAPDAIYTHDTATCYDAPPRVPHPAFNWNTSRARASIMKLQALAPATLWPGHGEHLSGDVSGQLGQAAAAGWPDLASRENRR